MVLLLFFQVYPLAAQYGAVDPNFSPPALTRTAGAPVIRALGAQTGGKILIAGDFDQAGGSPAGNLVRLLPDGSRDPSFQPLSGANGTIRCMAVQSDQKIVIGGDFTEYDGVPRARIARLLENGTLDTAFDPGTGFDGPVHCLALQFSTSTTFFAGGAFSTYNGSSRGNLALINAAGALITTFTTGTNGPVHAILTSDVSRLGADVVVGGEFTTVGASSRMNLAGLRNNGSLMGLNSNAGQGPNGPVHSISPSGLSSAPIAIGGDFTTYSGWPRSNLAFLLTSPSTIGGTSDYLSFESTPLIPGTVRAIADNRTGFASLLVAGTFTSINSAVRNRFSLLQYTTSTNSFFTTTLWLPSTGYHTGTGADGDVLAALRTSDGKMMIGGSFQSVDGAPLTAVARLLGSAGTTPPSAPAGFVAGGVSESEIIATWSTVTNTSSYRLEASPDGIGDWMTLSNSSSPRSLVSGLVAGSTRHLRVIAMNSNGDSPPSPVIVATTATAPWTGPGRPDPAISVVEGGTLEALELGSDGLLVGAGPFTDSSRPDTVVRHRLDGSQDLSFNTGTISPNGSGFRLATAPGGKTYVSGTFNTIGGLARDSIARLNADGTADPSFAPPIGEIGTPVDIGVQRSGKLVVAGAEPFANADRGDLVRLRLDGSIDPDFDAVAKRVTGMTVVPNDRLVVWGSSMVLNGQNSEELAVLTADGLPDPSFMPVDFTGDIWHVLRLKGGKWLVTGNMTAMKGSPCARIVRLLADGSADPTFNVLDNPGAAVFAAVEQPDGKLVVGGSFISAGSRIFPGIARYEATGSLDETFRPGSGTFQATSSTTVSDLVLLPDLRLAAAGSFNQYGGAAHEALAFITGDPPPVSAPAPPLLTASLSPDAGTVLAWPATTDAFDRLVQRSPDGVAGWQTLSTEEHATTTFTISRPVPATPEFYRILARNAAGETASNVVPATSNDAYLAWKLLSGIPATADDESDADGDQTLLLLEYALDLDPGQPDRERLPQPVRIGNLLGIVFTPWRGDIDYHVEFSPDLDSWSTGEVTLFHAGVTFGLIPLDPGEKGFIRLRVAR